jgi:hypothetical protein
MFLNEKMYKLAIDWETPVLIDSIQSINKIHGEWGPYHLKYLGEQKIKDLTLVEYPIKQGRK